MAYDALTQRLISLKKLAGKAQTTNNKDLANESLPSGITMTSNTVFGSAPPTSPASSALYDITDNVEYLRFPVSFILGSNTPAGRHGFALQLPADYESNSSNPKAGTYPFKNNQVINITSGSLQLVPTSFSNSYEAKPYYGGTGTKDSGTQIPLLDPRDWYLDYFNGVLFQQDPPGTGAHAENPDFVEAYLYIGNKLSDEIASAGGDSSAQYLVLATTSSLSQERAFNPTIGLTPTDGGAGGNYTLQIDNSVVATLTGSVFSGNIGVGKEPSTHRTDLAGTALKVLDVGGNIRFREIDWGSVVPGGQQPKYVINELNDVLWQADRRFPSVNFYDATDRTSFIYRTRFTTGGSSSAVNDITVDRSSYTGPKNLFYIVAVDGTGTPDTFKWRVSETSTSTPASNAGVTWAATGVSMTGSPQTLNNGFKINFASTTGHAISSGWVISTEFDELPLVLFDGDNDTRIELEYDTTHKFVIDFAEKGANNYGFVYPQGRFINTLYYTQTNYSSTSVEIHYSTSGGSALGYTALPAPINIGNPYPYSNPGNLRDWQVLEYAIPSTNFATALRLTVVVGSDPGTQDSTKNPVERNRCAISALNYFSDRFLRSQMEVPYLSKYLTEQNVYGAINVYSGSLIAHHGLSGSLQELADGTPYLRSGTAISISTGSSGEVTISSTAVTGPAGSDRQIQFNDAGSFGASSALTFPGTEVELHAADPKYILRRTSNTQDSSISFKGSAGVLGASISHAKNTNDIRFDVFNGSSVEEILRLGDHYGTSVRQVTILSGSNMAPPAMQPRNTSDIAFFVSGAIGSIGTSTRGVSVFGGDTVVSGAIHASGGISGSLQQLTDGTSYLRQGPGVSIVSSSAGHITISAAGESRKKVVTFLSSDLGPNSAISVSPADFSTANYDAEKIDVFLNGQLLHSGSSTEVSSGQRDYYLDGVSSLRFAFDTKIDDVLDVIVYSVSS